MATKMKSTKVSAPAVKLKAATKKPIRARATSKVVTVDGESSVDRYSTSSIETTSVIPIHISLGQRIRNWRRSKDWSLNQLAEASDIAPSTLSKVENDILTLNYDRLAAVASAFGLSLSQFLADQETRTLSARPVMGRRSLFRYDQGEVVSTPNYEYHYLCTDLVVKGMVPIFSVVRARSLEEFGPLLRHDGEELIFVIKGQVTVHTEYYKSEVLDPMQGVYIDSTMGHAYINSGEGDAWIFSVNTSPIPAETLHR